MILARATLEKMDKDDIISLFIGNHSHLTKTIAIIGYQKPCPESKTDKLRIKLLTRFFTNKKLV